jgi:uncharacterized protein Usg
MPDHPGVLQSFVRQQWDMPPNIPKLHEFLNFWKDNIEASLHSVPVACAELMNRPNITSASAVYQIH